MTTARPRILYIDDDPGIGRLVQKTLAKHDFDVELAFSGDEGLARLATGKFDLVALDHHMPGQTGLQVLARIREFPDPPAVVYVTGSEDSHIAVSALKSGASDYVWKDVQGHFRELLAEALKTSLEKDKLRREKEAAEREVRAARDRAEILLKEVNHRVANSLAIVASLVNLQRNLIQDPQAKELFEQMRARIMAVASVHRRLYTSSDVHSVDLCEYLHSLMQELNDSLTGDGRNHRIELACAPIFIATDKAVSLGIVVTELVTNAFKYAYPANDSGEIRVRVETAEGGGVLTVEDDGVGLRGAAPSGTGLGSKVIGLMAASLGGAIEFADTNPGTRAMLSFTL